MTQTASIEVDETRFPLVVVTFVGVATDAEFEAYLERMSDVMARREVTATVLDASRAGPTPPKQRARQADWIKANADVLRRYSAGSAFVITSPLIRGLLTAILWLAPMPQAHDVFSSRAAAEQWAVARLRARGQAGVSRPRA
jgi:hypothetical protein